MIRRTFNKREIEELKKSYEHKIDKNNITTISKHKVNWILKDVPHRNKMDYITYSIIEWWKTIEFNSTNYKLLMRAVKNYKIQLFEEEIDQQLIHEETLFSVGRKLKMIPVNSPLEKDEVAFIKYRDVTIRKKVGDDFNNGTKGDLIITNLAAHHMHKDDDIYKWDKIKRFQFTERGFVFQMGVNTFIIELYDGKVLQVIMTNFFSKKRKEMFKKEKEWKY